MNPTDFIEGLSPKVKKYLNDTLPKPGEYLVFKLIKSDIEDKRTSVVQGVGRGSSLRRNRNSSIYVGYEVFNDPGEPNIAKRQKTIQYVTGTSRTYENGNEQINNIIGDVEFNSRGVCIARSNEVTKCIFMLLSAQNKNNPFRPKDSPITAEWYLVDNKTTAEDEDFMFEMIDSATEKLGKMKQDEKEAVATALAQNGFKPFVGMGSRMEDSKYLHRELRKFLDKEPKEFLIAAEDRSAMRKIQVSDAVKKNFLKFDEGNGSWYLEDELGKEVKNSDGGQLRITVEAVEDKWEKLYKSIASNAKNSKAFYLGLTQLLVSGKVTWINEDEHSTSSTT